MKVGVWSNAHIESEEGCALTLGCVGGKGGQGSSMLATGLAGLLARDHNTVLVDLDLNSTHRNMLEREDCPGISNLALMIEEIPSLSTGNILQRHPFGFDVLAGPRTPEESAVLTRVSLNLILRELGREYDLVIIDISSNHQLITMGVLDPCSLAFLVVHPDLLALRCAKRVIEMANRCGDSSVHWGLVINGSRAGDLVQPFQASEALGIPLLAILPDDPAAGEDFSNILKPSRVDSPYGTALEQLTIRMRLKQSSTSTVNKSFTARCLRALRSRPKEPRDPRPGGCGPYRSDGGVTCAQ